jgi:hypothetical protein
MFCEKYKCAMSEAACVKRQQLHTSGYNRYWGERDPGCQDCAQGKQIMNIYQKGETMTEDQANYNWSSTKDQQKQCRHCGLMVSMIEAGDHFYRSNNAKDGFEGTCKKCKTKMATERRRAKKAEEQGKPDRKEKKTPAPAVGDTQAAPDPVGDILRRVGGKKENSDTIKKNDHGIDWDEVNRELNTLEREAEKQFRRLAVPALDDLVKELCDRAGYPDLYADLEGIAREQMRPPHLQLLYMLSLFNKMPAPSVSNKTERLH